MSYVENLDLDGIFKCIWCVMGLLGGWRGVLEWGIVGGGCVDGDKDR
jgi:hypothetical protein